MRKIFFFTLILLISNLHVYSSYINDSLLYNKIVSYEKNKDSLVYEYIDSLTVSENLRSEYSNVIRGLFYSKHGKFRKSIELLNESVPNMEETDFLYFKAKFNLALSYFETSQNVKANKILLDLCEKAPSPYNYKSYNLLGGIFLFQRNYKKALPYLEKTCDLAFANGDSTVFAGTKENIGIIYKNWKKYDKALECYDEALKIKLRIGNKEAIAKSYNNYGLLYKNKKQYDKALLWYFKSLKLKKESGVPKYIASTLNNISIAYNLSGEYNKAIEFGKESLKYTKGSKLNREKMYAYESLQYAYSHLKDYKNAFKNLELYSETYLKEYNEKSNKRVLDISEKYQSEKKAQQIKLLEKDKALQQAEIKQKNTTIYASLGGVVALVLLFVVYRHRQIAKLELAHKKEQLAQEEYNNLFNSHKLKSIQATIAGQEEERFRISKELHDGVCSELTGVRMQLEAGLIDSNKAVTELNKIYENTRQLSHDLIPPEFSDSSFYDMLESLLKSSLGAQKANLSYNVDDVNLSDEVQFNIYRIIQEAVANINKHSKSDNVEVLFKNEYNKLYVSVYDDGVGFNTANIGNGIKNIQSRVDALGGKLLIDSGNSGTKLEIEVEV